MTDYLSFNLINETSEVQLIAQASCFLIQVSEGVRRGHGGERGSEKADQLLGGGRQAPTSGFSEAASSKE